jgi:DNA polymerase-1
MQRLEAADFVLALTDSARNWRFDHYPPYKGNRHQVTKLKPVLLAPLRDILMKDARTYLRPRLEGDDILGILATKPKADAIVVTLDKDLKTIPGRHYHMSEDESFEVDEPAANRFHLMQTLTGDRTDGYPGCPGLGEVSAAKILPAGGVATKDIPAVWNDIVVPAYLKAGLTEADALSQARCARILRWTDYNFKTREVIPWSPTNARTKTRRAKSAAQKPAVSA